VKTAFPDEYVDRGISIEREERDARLDTPIFVCTLAFPGMPTILHVFEPRYRLMIRRCIESSSPRFGMLLPSRATGQGEGLQGVMEYGTMLEIQSVQMLPDGRSMVETIGTHRFKLLEKGSLDGYTIGRIER
jgi:Lon protease-like protein